MSRLPQAVILVVEPDAPTLQTMCAALVLDNPTVIQCASAEAALVVLRERSAALVISALRMPGMDGLEFLRQAYMLRPGVLGILLIDGTADLEVATEALASEKIYRFWDKPWDTVGLRLLVRYALRG